MQKAHHIQQAMRNLGKKRQPLTRVYRNLYSVDLFLNAYNKLYRNNGALTKGTEDDTVDGMNMKRIHNIINEVRYERFRFRPVRRTQIPKKGKRGTRPLGIPNFSEKLVQEALRMILNAYYEPRFRDSSHGFRPKRGCHTALLHIKENFKGTVWFIEGDIRGCFDNINHTILLDILSKDIQDGRLHNLIRRIIEAGYMEAWEHHKTYSGVPQGGIISPLLSNIYLHELDVFVEDELIPQYTLGKKRAPNPEYHQLANRAYRARKRGDMKLAQEYMKQMRQLPSQVTHDPQYKRLKYCRYADDFILGFIGSKAEAEEIKTAIGAFLKDKLKLELSAPKTLITHARTQKACFLGYAVSTVDADSQLTRRENTPTKTRAINGVIRLGIPFGLVDELAKRYQQKGKPIHEAPLLMFSDAHIIDIYQQRYRGIAEYYKYAVDRYHLGKLKFIMETAMMKTIASKYKISVSKAYRKYRGKRTVNGQVYKTVEVNVPTKNGNRNIYWGAIPLKVVKTEKEYIHDRQYQEQYTDVRSDLIRRLQADTCEICGSHDRCEVHHVRKLSDLKKRWAGRKSKPEWVKRMIALRRKTLIVCYECHRSIHNGSIAPKIRI
jgi:group II intron reverse transcriptase/maturase